LDDTHVAISIGDVCGKGLPAALVMSHLQASLRAFASPQASPQAVVTAINGALCRHGDLQRFVTLFYGVYDTESRVLSFSNAGHNPPVLLRRDGSIARLSTGGTVTGVFEEATYEAGAVRLVPGDRLVLFTDGVTEASSPERTEFGDDRLLETLRRAEGLDAEGVLDCVFADVRAFSRSSLQDDATAVVLDVQQ
jgi:phosphoserine phosphatase RsbU/P